MNADLLQRTIESFEWLIKGKKQKIRKDVEICGYSFDPEIHHTPRLKEAMAVLKELKNEQS